MFHLLSNIDQKCWQSETTAMSRSYSADSVLHHPAVGRQARYRGGMERRSGSRFSNRNADPVHSGPFTPLPNPNPTLTLTQHNHNHMFGSINWKGQFAPWNFHCMAFSLPWTFSPPRETARELSFPRTFVLKSIRSQEHSLPRTFVQLLCQWHWFITFATVLCLYSYDILLLMQNCRIKRCHMWYRYKRCSNKWQIFLLFVTVFVVYSCFNM